MTKAQHERGYSQEVVARFTDKYGEDREVHKTRHGLAVARLGSTVPMELNAVIGPLIGQRIRQARQAAGIGMLQLHRRAGLPPGGNPKQRIHEIEVGSRRCGVRFGTAYAIAAALGIDPLTLFPSLDEVMRAAGVSKRADERLDIL